MRTQAGVNIPNVFRLFFEVAVADGSKLRRPLLVLSERRLAGRRPEQLYFTAGAARSSRLFMNSSYVVNPI